MAEKQRVYIAIDLKSFYASVECRDRRRDPLTTNLVVADESRTEKTICLAVSPALKSYGIPGRARLFEVIQKVREVNAIRRISAPGHKFTGKSVDALELAANPSLELDFIAACPRMAMYMDYSTKIYSIYLKYVAAEDIHVYSIDEVFMDVTDYLNTYGITPRELAMRMILDVLGQTGITATAGIGTNLYLCKIAMDVEAKHIPPDENGVRIAELDEMSYRRKLWDHRPLTDFWRVGRGISRKLESHGIYTMGDIARCSLGTRRDFHNEDLLYKLFGVNAELLIDHAWGWEPCTMKDIKAYRPENSSISSGQVLHCPYEAREARLVVREMADMMALDLVSKKLTTDQIVLTVGYDIENLTDPARRAMYRGEIVTDYYGRETPKNAHGTINLPERTSSSDMIVRAAMELYDRIIDHHLLVRRMYVVAGNVQDEDAQKQTDGEQLDMFTDYAKRDKEKAENKENLEAERKIQEAMLKIKQRYGSNAILKGMNLQEGATAKDRNSQIGGHKA